MIAAALLLLFFPESTFVFHLVIFGGAVVTLHMFFRMMKDASLVRFGNIACFSILFGYVVSTAGYAIMNLKEYGEVSYRQNVFGFGYSQSIISYAMLTILMVSVLLSAVAHFEKPLCISEYLQKSLSKKFVFLIVMSAVAIVFGYFDSDIGYSGIYFVSERRISPFGALCMNAISPLAVISIGYLLCLPNALKKYRKFLIAVAVFFVIALIPLGRRVLMYTMILAVISIGPTLFESFQRKRIKRFHLLGAALAVFVIIFCGTQLFFMMRVSLYKSSFDKKPSLSEIAPYTIDLMRDSYAITEFWEKQIDNISQRPFVLSYLAGLLEVHTKKDTHFFGELGHALGMAIPSFFFPQKTRELASSSEGVSHRLLGIPVFDGPNTFLTAGLNDLGLMGMLIYPVGIVGLFTLIVRLIPANCPPFIYTFIVLRLMYSILYIEEGLGAIVGSGLRDLFIVAVFYWAILKLPLKRFSVEGNKKTHD